MLKNSYQIVSVWVQTLINILTLTQFIQDVVPFSTCYELSSAMQNLKTIHSFTQPIRIIQSASQPASQQQSVVRSFVLIHSFIYSERFVCGLSFHPFCIQFVNQSVCIILSFICTVSVKEHVLMYGLPLASRWAHHTCPDSRLRRYNDVWDNWLRHIGRLTRFPVKNDTQTD